MNYPWLNDYLSSKTGVTKDYKEEWGWDRYMIGNKLFAAICTGSSHQKDIVTLKLEPSEGEFLRNQYPDIIPGYYMNKIHWNSVYLDGNVPDDLLKDMLDKSYQLILNSLSKKLQQEIKSIGGKII